MEYWAAEDGPHVLGEIETVGVTTTPPWVTVNVAEAVLARTVITPIRVAVEVLAATLTVIVAPLIPAVGENVNHVESEVAFHEVWLVETTVLVD